MGCERCRLTIHLIAHNLVRAIMLEAATAYAHHLERLSFKGSIATLRQWAPTLAQTQCDPEGPHTLYEPMLYHIATDRVPHRPNRTESRPRKRRPKN